jgi:hypothetical protein
MRGQMTGPTFEQLMTHFGELGVESLVLATLTIERHAAPQAAITVRHQLAPGAGNGPELTDWALHIERLTRSPAFAERVMSEHVTVSRHAEIRLAHHKAEGGLRAHACTVLMKHPFEFSLESSPGLALLLGRCDGTLTCAELLEELKRIGALPADLPQLDFVRLLRLLICGTVLELPGHRLGEAQQG